MLSRRSFLNSTFGAGVAMAMSDSREAAAQGPAAQPARKRLIVDSQVHVWSANTPERPWVPGARPQLPEPMTHERLIALMDEAGVDRVVIVPPGLEGDRIACQQEAVKKYPGRFGIMARITLNDPKSASRLPAWREQPGVLGIRLNITAAAAPWLTDGTADWLWPAAEKAGVPIMFLTTGHNLEFGRIAERHPQLTLIIDHLGVSSETRRNNKIPETVEQSVALAKYPNVSVKLAATPGFSTEPYPFRDMTPFIRRLFEAYGPRRCYWGTDMTNSFAKATYRQRVTHFTEELDFLSEDDKDWVMGRALVERLRWT